MRKAFDDYHLLHNGGHRGSLWLGTDHLLIIEPVHFLVSLKETYRRLDYDSIQGIFVAKTTRSRITNTLLALVLGAALLLAIALGKPGEAGFFIPLAWAVALAILLATNLWRGPTAGIIVQTAVKPWKLGCVRRLRQANKIMDALAERCAAAQGGLLDPSAELPQATFPAPRPSGILPDATDGPPPPPVPGEHPEAHAETPHPNIPLGYLSLALFGILLCCELRIDFIAFSVVMIVAGILAAILLAAGAARHNGLRRTGSPAVWSLSIAFLVVTGISGYALSIVGVIAGRLGGSMNGQLEMVRIIARFPQGSPPAAITYALVLGAGCLVCAALGLLACQWQYKRSASHLPGPNL